MDFFIDILFRPFFLLVNYLKAKENFAFILVMLANLAIRLTVIDVADLGLDETIAISEANNNTFGFSDNQLGYSVFEPVYKFVLFIWSRLVAFSVYGMRSFDAILFSIVGGIVFKKINTFIGFRVACWASLFYFINNALIFHSQNIGNSSFALLLTIISSFSFVNLCQYPTLRSAVKLGIINCILFYVSNAFVSVILIQLLCSLFFLKRNIKPMVMSFIVVLAGCNYFLFRYFIVNDLLAHQLNIGLYWENVIKLFHLNFGDYFFFNLMILFTITMVLNIFVKKLDRDNTPVGALISRYSFIMCILTFIFIVKSEAFLHHDIEMPGVPLFSLSLAILLGLLFGLQRFSARINLLSYLIILSIFLPSLQLGASKNWNSKALVKVFHKHQSPNTVFICNNFLPFLFYLDPDNFRHGKFTEPEYQRQNIINIKGLSQDQIKKKMSGYDTVIYIDHKRPANLKVDTFLMQAGYNIGPGDKIFGNYELRTFYKTRIE